MLVSLPKGSESVSLTWPNITALFGLRINSSTLLIDGISRCQRYWEHHPAASAFFRIGRFFHVEKRPVWIWEENNMFLEDYEVQLSLEQYFLSKSITKNKIYVSVV